LQQLEFTDSVRGPSVVTWDGLVLEVFTEQAGSGGRLHARLLHVTVKGPDRKGRYEVALTTKPGGSGGGTTLFVSGDDWPDVQPFIEAVAAAT
jgi:hypothetical protein